MGWWVGGIRGRCWSSPECIQSAVCGQKQAWGGRRGPEPQGVSGSARRAVGRGLGRECEPLCAVGTARRSLPQQVGGGRLGVGIRVEQWSLGPLSSPQSLEGRVTWLARWACGSPGGVQAGHASGQGHWHVPCSWLLVCCHVHPAQPGACPGTRPHCSRDAWQARLGSCPTRVFPKRLP